ncbi:MAG: putative glycolipid-binding domain-containing protein [Shinella sp.]|nr:putative glycolipid-binding domain-containing protein [Shinella sp.]
MTTRHALWRRLDTPGHDAARLAPSGEGWRLQGSAVFLHEHGPAAVRYEVELSADWKTLSARLDGFVAGTPVDHAILRGPDGWVLDGTPAPGFAHLVDIDFGFTPATNLLQLERVALAPGEAADVPVAWFDLGETGFTDLPQRYERLDASRYAYASPTAGYAGTLEVAENGFARIYPGLWEMIG